MFRVSCVGINDNTYRETSNFINFTPNNKVLLVNYIGILIIFFFFRRRKLFPDFTVVVLNLYTVADVR